jgi:hypothetical protein
VRRYGKSRPFSRNQEIKASRTGSTSVLRQYRPAQVWPGKHVLLHTQSLCGVDAFESKKTLALRKPGVKIFVDRNILGMLGLVQAQIGLSGRQDVT